MTVTKHSHCQKGPDSTDSDLRQCSDSAPTVLRQCSDSPDSSDSTDSQGSETGRSSSELIIPLNVCEPAGVMGMLQHRHYRKPRQY